MQLRKGEKVKQITLSKILHKRPPLNIRTLFYSKVQAMVGTAEFVAPEVFISKMFSSKYHDSKVIQKCLRLSTMTQ